MLSEPFPEYAMTILFVFITKMYTIYTRLYSYV